jgi:hypothetical protein
MARQGKDKEQGFSERRVCMKKRRKGIDREVIRTTLESVRMANGGKLRPADVVASSQPEDAALHPCFTWDDAVAAEQHRLWEARELIREVTVVINERRTPAYYSVPQSEPSQAASYYVPAELLIESPDEFQMALEMLLQKFESAKRALEDLRELAGHSQNYADKMQMISVALAAFSAAGEAVRRIQ